MSTTPFDSPKGLWERLAYPLARRAYWEGYQKANAKQLDRPSFSQRYLAWRTWELKWADRHPNQHDHWVFDEGLRAGLQIMAEFDLDRREET